MATVRRKTNGEIDANKMYTAGDLRRRGMGAEVLSQARQSKVVVPMRIGNSTYYAGDELIAWGKQCKRVSGKAAG